MSSRFRKPVLLPLSLGMALLVATACEREERRLTEMPPTATPTSAVVVSDLQPGPAVIHNDVEGPYDDKAYSTNEGETLFNQMNCVGCHANGGGGMGPPLMDATWIYGSQPEQIFSSIAEGRPNGMPAWKYKLSTPQIWELVAYVRSLGGLTPKGARPGRTDHMMTKPTPNQTHPEKPVMTGESGSEIHP